MNKTQLMMDQENIRDREVYSPLAKLGYALELANTGLTAINKFTKSFKKMHGGENARNKSNDQPSNIGKFSRKHRF